MNAGQLQSVLSGRLRSDPILRDLLRVAVETDAELYVVGGYVRDAALRRRASDLDLVCTRHTLRLLRGLENLWDRRGYRFRKRGVTTWLFALPAGQVDLVDATRRGLLRDLQRRESTLNAIAFDLRRGRLNDPLRGLAALRAGRIELPRPGVIGEDPVRALRAARFASRFPQFTLGRALLSEAAAARAGLRRASAERVRDELNRLLAAPAPQRGLLLLQELGLIDSVLPELAALRSCVAGQGRPDVWSHTVAAIARTAGSPRLPGSFVLRQPDQRRQLRWALLLHDISKPETLRIVGEGKPTFHGHEVLGARRADSLLRRLILPRAERRRIGRLIRLHLRPGHLADSGAPPRGMRRLVREAGDDLPLLVLHSAADARASGAPDASARWRRLHAVLGELLELQRRMRNLPGEPLLDGEQVMNALNIPPGPEVGRILQSLRERQDAGTIRTADEALAALPRIARASRG